jgi:methylated-DNA-[protein]-cysteine S-methyltransferase
MVPHPKAGMGRSVALVSTMASRWGPIHLAVTDGGVAAVAWASPIETLIAGLESRLHGDVAEAVTGAPDDPRQALLEQAVGDLERWLAGEPVGFDVPLDLTGSSAWDRAVLEGVRRIPWGRTESYGGVARMIGRPGAARAVGGAVGRNPIGVIVPCHRVIAGDGSIGGYGGDAWGSRASRLALKRDLLRMEGVTLPPATD